MSSVKDYIIDLNKVEEEKIETPSGVKSAPKIEYTLIVENDMDFVLNRKSARQNKDLVFLISQDLFYIKDNKTEIITKLDYNNFKRQVSTFTKDIADHRILTKTKWGESIATDRLFDIFNDDTKRKFFRAGIYNMTSYDMGRTERYLDKNKKLLKIVIDKFGANNISLMDAVFYLNETFSFNNAMFLMEKLEEIRSPMLARSSSYLINMLKLLNNTTIRFDTNSFITYLVNELYAQGIDSIDYEVYNNYRDYLTMYSEMYDGKVKVKYPKHLKTDHDKLVMKYNLWKRYKDDLAILEITKEHQDLEYKGREYSIIIPQTSADIIDEGVQQCNCVGSYIERVAQGNTFVCFMRKNTDPDHSYVTIEVKNGNVCQVKGFANRVTYKEEDDFIKKWAKDKNLKVTYK